MRVRGSLLLLLLLLCFNKENHCRMPKARFGFCHTCPFVVYVIICFRYLFQEFVPNLPDSCGVKVLAGSERVALFRTDLSLSLLEPECSLNAN